MEFIFIRAAFELPCFLLGRADNNLIEKDCNSLSDESLRTELKKCQDALEAQVGEVQAKDLKLYDKAVCEAVWI